MLSAPAILRGLSGIVVNDVSERSPSAKDRKNPLDRFAVPCYPVRQIDAQCAQGDGQARQDIQTAHSAW
jgi:hypothetical protein